MNFAKILRTPFLQNISRDLLLNMYTLQNSCSTEYQVDCIKQIFENLSPMKFNFRNIAGLQLASLITMEHFHSYIFIRLALRTVIL